jgi:tRNA A-37 threonylcarbamoyl transferase component Bud32
MESDSQWQAITWERLLTAPRENLAPFTLSLADNKDVLQCQQIVRIMPGKRLVAFGTWGGKAVVAKLFYQRRRASVHAQRDFDGIQALQKAGVLTPVLLYKDTSTDKHIYVLIFERILAACSLDDIWRLKTSYDEVLPIMRAVTVELATQHVLGVTQRDLHFKNFLLQKKNIYTLDGGDIGIINVPLSKKDSIDHLGLFFSQLGIGSEALQEKLFQIYVQARGWIVTKHDVAGLQSALEKWYKKRCSEYQQKIFRTCTAFVRQKTATSLTLYDRDYETTEFLAILKNPEAALAKSTTELLKSGRSATVVEITVNQRPMILKRYNIKNILHGLRRCLRQTRAANHWRLAHRLRLLGIPTAKPIAFIEKRFLGLRGKSYLFLDYIDGVHAGDFFTDPVRDIDSLRVVAQQVVLLIENLAKLRITHGDLKMTNILISKQKPILIDLDGMQTHQSDRRFRRAFDQEIKRFMRNWQDRPILHNMFSVLVEDLYRRLL